MELEEAIIILEKHQEWRRFDGEIEDSPKMQHPKKVGIAIDKILEHVKL